MSLFINGKQLLQYISTQILVKFVKKNVRENIERFLKVSITSMNSRSINLCAARKTFWDYLSHKSSEIVKLLFILVLTPTKLTQRFNF